MSYEITIQGFIVSRALEPRSPVLYSYNPLGWLTSTTYSGTGNYSSVYSYDAMGNVESIIRYGRQDNNSYSLVDDLTFTYCGNQVIKVDDTVSGPDYAGAFHFVDGTDEEIEYEYDPNSNMTKDSNKGISSIQYNLLNLPSTVRYTDGSTQRYVYDTTGRKLQTIISDAYSFEIFLNKNSENWKNRFVTGENLQIVLFSCGTGSKGKFAQTLSMDETFLNVKIFAPSEDVTIYEDGSSSVDNNKSWIEYMNGEIHNIYSGELLPGTTEFENASFWEKDNNNTYKK